MPAVAIDDDAVSIAQSRIARETVFDRAQDAALLFLAVGVELIQLGRQLPGAGRFPHAEKFDHIASNIHSAGSIDAWSDAESDFA